MSYKKNYLLFYLFIVSGNVLQAYNISILSNYITQQDKEGLKKALANQPNNSITNFEKDILLQTAQLVLEKQYALVHKTNCAGELALYSGLLFGGIWLAYKQVPHVTGRFQFHNITLQSTVPRLRKALAGIIGTIGITASIIGAKKLFDNIKSKKSLQQKSPQSHQAILALEIYSIIAQINTTY